MYSIGLGKGKTGNEFVNGCIDISRVLPEYRGMASSYARLLVLRLDGPFLHDEDGIGRRQEAHGDNHHDGRREAVNGLREVEIEPRAVNGTKVSSPRAITRPWGPPSDTIPTRETTTRQRSHTQQQTNRARYITHYRSTRDAHWSTLDRPHGHPPPHFSKKTTNQGRKGGGANPLSTAYIATQPPPAPHYAVPGVPALRPWSGGAGYSGW